MTPGTSSIEVWEAVALAHLYLDRLCQSHGIRMLHIKGPIVVAQGVAQGRASSDADVIVDPRHANRVAPLLSKDGWFAKEDGLAPRTFAVHSQTFENPSWPCHLDVHQRYPGFFADDQDAFEHLWARRSSVFFHGHELATPGVADSALILAAHALRSPRSYRSAPDLQSARDVMSRPEISMDDVAASVIALRAADTLRPFLSHISVDVPHDQTQDEAAAWSLVAGGDGRSSTHHWLAAWRSRGVMGRLRVLLLAARSAVGVVRAAIRAEEPTTTSLRRRADAWRSALSHRAADPSTHQTSSRTRHDRGDRYS